MASVPECGTQATEIAFGRLDASEEVGLVGEERSDSVLAGQCGPAGWELPVDGEGGVVPADRPFDVRHPDVAHLVGDALVGLERGEAVGEPGGDQQLVAEFRPALARLAPSKLPLNGAAL